MIPRTHDLDVLHIASTLPSLQQTNMAVDNPLFVEVNGLSSHAIHFRECWRGGIYPRHSMYGILYLVYIGVVSGVNV